MTQPAAASKVAAPFDSKQLRRMLGLFPTGVTIVTTRDAQGAPIGATVSSFNSVSLEPPLVLFSMSSRAYSNAAFAAAEYCTIHVLRHDQSELSNRFAKAGADKWQDLPIASGVGDVPQLPDTLATFECRIQARYPGGDHLIYLVEILKMHGNEGEPLVFFNGAYHRLASKDTAQHV